MFPMIRQKKSAYAIIAMSIISGGLTFPAYAQTLEAKKIVDILPARTLEGVEPQLDHDVTDPALQLSPDRSELIRLERDAASIIIGNSNHLNVVADSPRTIVVIPRMPGVSNFTVLDHEGNTIMQREVIVAGPKQNYVRIRNTCTGQDSSCKKTDVYYCPDTCHEVGLVRDSKEPSSVTSYEFSDSFTESTPSGADDEQETEQDAEALKKQISELENELKKANPENAEDEETAEEE